MGAGRSASRRAAVAAALFWIWPPFLLFQLTHQQGFYASNVVYCSLLLLLALRVVEQPSRTRVGLFGLVLGLAFWQTAQIVPVAAGVIAWTIWKQPRCLRHVWVAVPLAALGALPWIVWNVGHDWESLVQHDYGDKLRSLRLLASPVLPMMAGLRAPFSAELLLPKVLTYVVYVSLIALFIYGAVKARDREASILYFVTAVFPIVYMLSPKTTWSVGTPRFIVVLAPVLVLLFSQLATRFARAVALLVLAAVISVVTVQRMDVWFRTQSPNMYAFGPRQIAHWVPRDLGPLIFELNELHLDHVYTDYWLSYRLAFDSRERIIAANYTSPTFTWNGGQAIPTASLSARYPAYQDEVKRARHGFVFYRQTIRASRPAITQLEQHGYRRYVAGSFVVYAPPDTVAHRVETNSVEIDSP